MYLVINLVDIPSRAIKHSKHRNNSASKSIRSINITICSSNIRYMNPIPPAHLEIAAQSPRHL